MFDDPLENLTGEQVCTALSDAMSSMLVDGARQAGAVGPVACSVVLLQGAQEHVKRRLFYEQAIYELKKTLVFWNYKSGSTHGCFSTAF